MVVYQELQCGRISGVTMWSYIRSYNVVVYQELQCGRISGVTMWSYIIANAQRHYISTDTIDWEIFAVTCKIFSLLHWSDKN